MKILMVDDDAEDRELLQHTLEALGHRDAIHFEENGEDAIRFLQQCTHYPCLIILDLNMPRLNGRQTLQYIKSQPKLQQVTTLIYSTSLNPVERDECLSLGAHSYIIKPVTYAEGLAIARKFLALCEEAVCSVTSI